MKAMILKSFSLLNNHKSPLVLEEVPIPEPKANEVLLKVATCGVCHTELDEIEGRITNMKLPIIPGHQVVGRVEKLGSDATKWKLGDRLGVAWIFSACGNCNYCLEGRENLCEEFRATGKDANGGYAEYMVVPEEFAFKIPEEMSDEEAAPLLCAGAIGYRSIRLSKLKNGDSLGLTGFGASAHLVLKLVKAHYPETKVYVFARQSKEREFAMKLGAKWAGKISEPSPIKLNCIIETTPVWEPILHSLNNLCKGGRLVINAIRKEDVDKNSLQNISYQDHLWKEKEIKSVANVTRHDVQQFLKLAVIANISPEVETYKLEEANLAILALKNQHIRGAKVLKIL